MADKTVLIARFGDTVEAEMAKNRLEAEGIPAFLGSEATGGLFAGLGHAFGGIALHVREVDWERAARLLQEIEDKSEENEGPPEEEVELGATAEPPAPDHDVEEWDERPVATEPGLEGEEEPRHPIQRTADDLAAYAWRAAVLGFIVCPFILHVYSLYLLLRVALMPDSLTAAWKRKAIVALVLDLVVLIFVTLAFQSALGR
jgi:hypothetical protein